MAPQLALVLPDLTPGLPNVHLYIFSIVSIIGSVLAILVPDTVNSSLPENFDQVQNFIYKHIIVKYFYKVIQIWSNQKKFWSIAKIEN